MFVRVVVFDLDDTLYDEISFVKSAFKAVALYFEEQYKLDSEIFYEKLLSYLEILGRGKVFDETLKFFELYSKKNVKKALSIYRTHKPNISLSDESLEILTFLNKKKIPIYIVTDGNKIVQNNKIEALKLRKYIKKDFITHRYGKKYSKPSTYCFEKIAKLEKLSYEEIVYIADNPNKDFINIKKLKFRTIRIKKGMFKNLEKASEYEAEFNINSLLELKDIVKLP